MSAFLVSALALAAVLTGGAEAASLRANSTHVPATSINLLGASPMIEKHQIGSSTNLPATGITLHDAAPATENRNLAAQAGYGFVISHIRNNVRWCLTAAHGASNNANLRLRLCDFDESPANQMWRFDEDGKLHTLLDDSKCMVANFGQRVFNGVRMRINDCDLDTNYNKFNLQAGGRFSLATRPNYCITNRGPNPHPSDTIHAKPCKNRKDYRWTFSKVVRKVLVLGAANTAWGNEIGLKISSTNLFSEVDVSVTYNAAVPTLAVLQEYDSVLVFTDSPGFSDRVLMGDVLADFVDGGGCVSIATFALYQASAGLGLSGRLISGGYLPVNPGPQSQGTPLTMNPVLPNHPLLEGVTSFNGGSSSYHNLVSLANGATLVANWSNGRPLVAYKGNVVALNFFPPSSDSRGDFWLASTDGARLLANSLLPIYI